MARLICNISLRPATLSPLCFWTLIEEDLHVKVSHRVRVSGQASHLVRVSGQTVPTTGMKLPYGNYQIGIKKAVSWGRHHVILIPKRNRSFQNTSFEKMGGGMHTTIFGYWGGPDMEDGWGYVEAVVDRGH